MVVPGARDWLLDRKIVPDDVGLELVDDAREFLERLEPRRLAEFLIGGLATGDITGGFDDEHFALAEYSPDASRVRHAPAAQHALHPRHHVLAVRGRHAQPAALPRPARRDAAHEGRLPVPPGLRRLDRVVGRPRAALGSRDHRGRRRHARRQRHRARRHERAHVATGHHAAGGRAVRPGCRRARGRRGDAPATGRDAPGHGVHVRGPGRGDALPEDRRRHPRVHAAAGGRWARAHHRRGRARFVDVVARALDLRRCA